jgi:alcohol dehydrogenase class IV
VIVRWGLGSLPGVLAEVGTTRPLLVTTERWRGLELPVDRAFYEVRPHVPAVSVEKAVEAAAEADGLLALGGGSAIDTAKAASAGTGLPVVSVPTTYSGAEWTSGFGMRDEERRVKTGGGGARVEGIVYDPELTYDLPAAETGGTALNGLAHCAEALYVEGQNDRADAEALAGARLISESLPLVLADGHYAEGRRALLEGAMHAGAALAGAGLALGHAMAQAVGGRYGIAHGAANAICLPPALRFNLEVAAEEIARLGEAMGRDDPVARVEELARLSGFTLLRHLGVPEDDLPALAEAAAERGGAKANPRPASAVDVLDLYRSVW